MLLNQGKLLPKYKMMDRFTTSDMRELQDRLIEETKKVRTMSELRALRPRMMKLRMYGLDAWVDMWSAWKNKEIELKQLKRYNQ